MNTESTSPAPTDSPVSDTKAIRQPRQKSQMELKAEYQEQRYQRAALRIVACIEMARLKDKKNIKSFRFSKKTRGRFLEISEAAVRRGYHHVVSVDSELQDLGFTMIATEDEMLIIEIPRISGARVLKAKDVMHLSDVQLEEHYPPFALPVDDA